MKWQDSCQNVKETSNWVELRINRVRIKRSRPELEIVENLCNKETCRLRVRHSSFPVIHKVDNVGI